MLQKQTAITESPPHDQSDCASLNTWGITMMLERDRALKGPLQDVCYSHSQGQWETKCWTLLDDAVDDFQQGGISLIWGGALYCCLKSVHEYCFSECKNVIYFFTLKVKTVITLDFLPYSVCLSHRGMGVHGLRQHATNQAEGKGKHTQVRPLMLA